MIEVKCFEVLRIHGAEGEHLNHYAYAKTKELAERIKNDLSGYGGNLNETLLRIYEDFQEYKGIENAERKRKILSKLTREEIGELGLTRFASDLE